MKLNIQSVNSLFPGGGTKGIESPKSDGKKENQQEKSKSEPVAQVPETTTLENSSSPLAKQSSVTSKKNKSLAMPSTPPSAVRRSGRAPVPSSRYKDMEVETPGSRKRSLASTTGGLYLWLKTISLSWF